jgi:hypothetical protein
MITGYLYPEKIPAQLLGDRRDLLMSSDVGGSPAFMSKKSCADMEMMRKTSRCSQKINKKAGISP